MNHSMHDHGHHGMMDMVNTTVMSMMNGTASVTHSPHHHGNGAMTDDPHRHHDHGGHEGHGDGNMHMNGSHGMMKMYFHTGVQEYVLFESCHTDSEKDMIVACIVIFLVAILYEGIKFTREVLLQRTLQNRSRVYYHDNKMVLPPSDSNEQIVGRSSQLSISQQMLSWSHTIQTFLHILQIFVSYCLMLVFMTFNVWLCVAVVLGAGFGYFIFGWKRAIVVDANEHCH